MTLLWLHLGLNDTKNWALEITIVVFLRLQTEMEPQGSQIQSPFKIINGPQLFAGTILRVYSICKLQYALHGPNSYLVLTISQWLPPFLTLQTTGNCGSGSSGRVGRWFHACNLDPSHVQMNLCMFTCHLNIPVPNRSWTGTGLQGLGTPVIPNLIVYEPISLWVPAEPRQLALCLER